MKSFRRLSLAKETLAELAPKDLGQVVAGEPISHYCTTECTSVITHGISCDRCPTVPINECYIQTAG